MAEEPPPELGSPGMAPLARTPPGQTEEQNPLTGALGTKLAAGASEPITPPSRAPRGNFSNPQSAAIYRAYARKLFSSPATPQAGDLGLRRAPPAVI